MARSFNPSRLNPQQRTSLISKRGARCEACGVRDAGFDIHHTRYDRGYAWGWQQEADLLILCRVCHQLRH